MALDLSLKPSEEIVSGPRSASEELSEAHALLLRRMEELRTLAERLDGRAAGIESLLARRDEAQLRIERQALGGLERHWGETAVRYRALADELSRRGAGLWRFERAKLLLGGLLLGVIVGSGATLWLHPPASPPAKAARP